MRALVLRLELFLSATTRDMSTSIALVTCAEVSSERCMCSAMPRRMAVIGSSTSPGAISGWGGSTGCVGGGGVGGSSVGSRTGTA